MQHSLIEEWQLSRSDIPYDVPCKLRQKHGRYIGQFEAHPMSKEDRWRWIGDMNRCDSVIGISTNTRHHIGQYNIALENSDVKKSKETINDAAYQMMWFAYPEECADLSK